MKKAVSFICILVFTFCILKSYAQKNTEKIDSLIQSLKFLKEDSNKANTLIILSEELRNEKESTTLSYSKMLLELSESINYRKGLAYAYYYIGYNLDYRSRYVDAMSYYYKALKIAESTNDTKLKLKCWNVIAILYQTQGNVKESFRFFSKGLELAIKVKDLRMMAYFNGNIGSLYLNTKDYSLANLYIKEGLKYYIQLNNNEGIAECYNNIGFGFYYMNQLDSALANCTKSLQISLKINYDNTLIAAYSCISDIYSKMKKNDIAIEYYTNALNTIYKSGYSYYRNNVKDIYASIAKVYEAKNDYTNAFHYQKLFLGLKDSVQSEQISNQVNAISSQYEDEKKQKEINELQNKNEIDSLKTGKQLEQIKRNRIVIYSIVGSIALVLILLLVLYSRYALKKKANNQLEEQNKIIAEKKKEIQDSIDYAKSIQRAILPKSEDIYKSFPECFGLYKPKDVVSGDFYWFAEHNKKIFVAAADCTGHGVPGGFMSMLGIDKLNYAVVEKQLISPAEILSVLNNGIKKSLKQSDVGSSSRDGMDVALCVFNLEKTTVTYAGANRALWIIRKENEAYHLAEISPTKMAIGGLTSDNQVYIEHTVSLSKGDTIYLCTDGYADQFGGENGKKLMAKTLKQMLLSIQHLSMSEQEIYLDTEFEKWKGSLEQIDDVLIFGIRIC
jgi:serine phosphatase RsbU (regulator of sigma subunit)/Tfp pilus assembly protein PilF